MRIQRHVVAPDDEHAHSVDERDDQDLGQYRVAQPHDRGYRGVELRPRDLRNQLAPQELLQHGSHASVHYQLGGDHERDCQQVTDLDLHVQEEGHGRRSGQESPLERGEHREWQSREQRYDDDASPEQVERVAGQVRATKELVQRSAEDQREIHRLLRWLRHSYRSLRGRCARPVPGGTRPPAAAGAIVGRPNELTIQIASAESSTPGTIS